MSVRWRAMWFSNSRPLPPRMSRAARQTRRPLRAWWNFASEAMCPVQRPCACSCAMWKQYSCMLVISLSISASRSSTSWKLAIGRLTTQKIGIRKP
jgi:hypothetical protein